MTGEALGDLMTELIGVDGVLDAYFTAVVMKKNRPGTLITVLTQLKCQEKIVEFLLIHTTSFGVRLEKVQRKILERNFYNFETPWGIIKLKAGKLEDKVLKLTPEYEDVTKIAKASGNSFFNTYAMAQGFASKLLVELNS